MQSFLAADDLSDGRLIEVLPETRSTGWFWLVWPHHLHRTPNVRTFLDYTTRAFGPAGDALFGLNEP